MEPVRLVDDNGNLVSSTTVVKASRLPSLSAIQQAAIDADNARSPYGQALPGMAVTPDTQVRKKITLEAAQAEAVATGDLAKIDEVFQLTYFDETEPNNFQVE